MKKILGLCLLVVCTSTAFAADPVPVIPPAQKTLSSQDGRYVFGQVSDFRRDQFLLDTRTGRMWKLSYETDKDRPNSDGQPILKPVLIEDIRGMRSTEPAPIK